MKTLKALCVLIVTFCFVTQLVACGSSAAPVVATPCAHPPTACSLRQLGRRAGITIGAATPADPITNDDVERRLLLSQFDSVTPEYQATWTALEPRHGHLNWGPLDALVSFAHAHRLSIRGHVLLWDQDHDLPGWVMAINDPGELRTVLDRHIRQVVGRYRGRIDRWDVVNEPLQTSGAQLHDGHLLRVLGPGYIIDAFRSAHAADPSASLWLNESNTEVSPSKAVALVNLAAELKREGVPIDGVGLETHLLSGRPPAPGTIESLIRRVRALGLQAAITELDVPVSASGSTSHQVAAYREVAAECRAAGCSEITTWGLDDSHTWLDARLHRTGTAPLLFDSSGNRKEAFYAFRDALARSPG